MENDDEIELDLDVDDDDNDQKFCCEECRLRFKKQKQKERKKAKRNKNKSKEVNVKEMLVSPEYNKMVDNYNDKLTNYLKNNKYASELIFWKQEYKNIQNIVDITVETDDLFSLFYIGQMIGKIDRKNLAKN